MQRELHQKVENHFKVFYFERIHQKRLLVRERACSRCQLQRWFVSSVSFSLGGSSLRERARGSEESSNSISPDTNMAPASADNFR